MHLDWFLLSDAVHVVYDIKQKDSDQQLLLNLHTATSDPSKLHVHALKAVILTQLEKRNCIEE